MVGIKHVQALDFLQSSESLKGRSEGGVVVMPLYLYSCVFCEHSLCGAFCLLHTISGRDKMPQKSAIPWAQLFVQYVPFLSILVDPFEELIFISDRKNQKKQLIQVSQFPWSGALSLWAHPETKSEISRGSD